MSTRHCGNFRRGFSLIELLVALTLATLLIIGAITMYSQSRGTYRASEEAARLQETARYAMSFIETDLRMANYWGLNSRPDYILTGGLTVNACGTNWAIAFDRFVDGSNDKEELSCVQSADYLSGGDVLIVRRVANERETGALEKDTLYLQTSRIQGTLFIGTAGPDNDGDGTPDDDCYANAENCLPSGYLPPQSETHRVLAHAYFIGPNSTGRPGVPSLRRVRLISGPAVQQEEIISGIEDLQLEFGIDTDFNATAEYYVPPGTALPVGARVVSVRVWLRVRSDSPDFQFVDGETYTYAGLTYTPDATGNANRYRRLLVSKTIQLRNTRYD